MKEEFRHGVDPLLSVREKAFYHGSGMIILLWRIKLLQLMR
jgi:hypothetical protein